jgi:hypothetical protein
MPNTFECGVCAADVEGIPVVIDSSPVCGNCIKDSIVPDFENALKFEARYPVVW